MTNAIADNHVPSGYAETMDALKRPKDWDVPGMIADVCEHLRRGLDVPPGQVLAMLDTLTFRMKDIAELIHHEHAKRISPDTIRQAAEIASVFVARLETVPQSR